MISLSIVHGPNWCFGCYDGSVVGIWPRFDEQSFLTIFYMPRSLYLISSCDTIPVNLFSPTEFNEKITVETIFNDTDCKA